MRVNVAAGLLCAVLVSPVNAAPPLPSAATIEANVKQAAGKPPTSFVSETRFTRSGIEGTAVEWHAGDDYRLVQTYGPLHHEQGSLGDQKWHQNTNGQTVYEPPEPGKAAKDVYTTTVTEISSPVKGYLITKLNAAHLGSKQYIEASTWHVVRTVDVLPERDVVTDFDDFRTTAGYTQSWHRVMRDGYHENDFELRVVGFEPKAVTRADIAIPKSSRALIEFPAGKTTVQLPARVVGNHMVVRVDIGGRGLDFGLDTGASGIVLDEEAARGLGLKPFGVHLDDGAADKYASGNAIVPQVSVGPLVMHNVAVLTVPFKWQAASDVKVVGVLGFDFIAELLLRLDYQHGTLTAFLPQLDLWDRLHAIPLNVRLINDVPYVTMSVNGAVGERFVIDTGFYDSVELFGFFARRYPTALKDSSFDLDPSTATGVGGTLSTRRVTLSDVELGELKLKEVKGALVITSRSYYADEDGLVGGALLKRFVVWLDYPNSRITLSDPASGGSAGGDTPSGDL